MKTFQRVPGYGPLNNRKMRTVQQSRAAQVSGSDKRPNSPNRSSSASEKDVAIPSVSCRCFSLYFCVINEYDLAKRSAAASQPGSSPKATNEGEVAVSEHQLSVLYI